MSTASRPVAIMASVATIVAAFVGAAIVTIVEEQAWRAEHSRALQEANDARAAGRWPNATVTSDDFWAASASAWVHVPEEYVGVPLRIESQGSIEPLLIGISRDRDAAAIRDVGVIDVSAEPVFLVLAAGEMIAVEAEEPWRFRIEPEAVESWFGFREEAGPRTLAVETEMTSAILATPDAGQLRVSVLRAGSAEAAHLEVTGEGTYSLSWTQAPEGTTTYLRIDAAPDTTWILSGIPPITP